MTKNTSTTISGFITKITPVSSNSSVTVNVSLGNGTVNEGWVPEGWSKVDDHAYTTNVASGTTFEMVLRAWNMEDKRLSYAGHMLQS
ncbi:MAG: hypothetical protein Q4F54_05130 [Coriobacteriia bacterium]|nr:hypothetical protein [Coriobacteriia bacterium]